MKLLISYIYLIFLCLTGLSSASQPLTIKPISAELKYANGLGVSAEVNLQKLTNVHFHIYGKAVKIPESDLVDIVNPELDLIYLQGLESDFTQTSEFRVNLKFERRPYDWGEGISNVCFVFTGDKYSHREIAVPIGKGVYTSKPAKADK
ncbi:MAG: hypothetical protein V4640_01460 [Verrucomicrobiota bacterium]